MKERRVFFFYCSVQDTIFTSMESLEEKNNKKINIKHKTKTNLIAAGRKLFRNMQNFLIILKGEAVPPPLVI